MKDIEHDQKITELFLLRFDVKSVYTSSHEANLVSSIIEQLNDADFYELVNLNHEKVHEAHRYTLIKHAKEKGLPIPNVMLFSCHHGPAVGGTFHYTWKESSGNETVTTE